ncbi:MAG: hypothetical protein ABII71_01105 [Candidatus Micrarchaeota archaeon]
MKIYLAITLAFALFLFGCTQPSGPAEGPAPVAPTASPEATQPPAETPSATTPGGQQEPANPETNDGVDLSTQTCMALMATGMPVECTMTTSYQGQSNTVKFWMQGEDNIRYEIAGQTPECLNMVMIYKENAQYMGCEGQKYFDTACDWYMVTSQDEAEGGPAVQESGTLDYESFLASMEGMPATECSCAPWVVDQSKFNTPGKVCDEQEFMDELMGGFDYQ